MLRRREFWAPVSFATALLVLSAASCTPDERSLLLDLRSPGRGDAGSSPSTAGSEELAGSPGSAGEDAGEGQAGESGTAGAPVVASGGTSQSTGGVAGGSSNGGTNSGGTSSSAGTGSGGTSHAGAPFSGPCGDIDGNRVDDCSETLVKNSQFDKNVEHWALGEWNAKNARATSPSGSLLVLNDSPVVPDVGFKLTAAEQCIQVTGDFKYTVAARVLIPAGQGGGFGGFNLLIFANDGCKGTFVTGLSPASTEATDEWTVVSAEFKMPTAARSMSIRLAATRPFAQAKLQVLFDDILVKQKLP
jgi:hypothetical protein